MPFERESTEGISSTPCVQYVWDESAYLGGLEIFVLEQCLLSNMNQICLLSINTTGNTVSTVYHTFVILNENLPEYLLRNDTYMLHVYTHTSICIKILLDSWKVTWLEFILKTICGPKEDRKL